jgi:hypothetical protein
MSLAELQVKLLAAIAGADDLAIAAVRPSEKLSAEARVDVYRRSHRARLLGCMQEILPVLRHALGDALFADFVADYVARHPPRGYTLDRLADEFPTFLAETRPRDEAWSELLVALASFEVALHRAGNRIVDGPGADEIFSLHGDRLLSARPERGESLIILRSDFPLLGYWSSVRAGQSPSFPDRAPEILAIGPTGAHPIEENDAALLDRFDGTRPLGDLRADRALPALRDRLALWASRGWLARL